MIWWILILAAITFLSYLSDVDVFRFVQEVRVPYLNASVLSVFLLFCMIGALARLLHKVKEGEKETLAQRIMELERKVKDLKITEK
jgi:hypothetical protein